MGFQPVFCRTERCFHLLSVMTGCLNHSCSWSSSSSVRPAGKAIEHDDEDEDDKRSGGNFVIVLVVVVVLVLPGEESNRARRRRRGR
jgi:hypothetical protein